MKKILCLPIFAAIFLLMVIPLSPFPIANAATITVPTDFPTIQKAIEAASGGDTIKVLAGKYTEQLVITKSLTIIGSGAKSTTIEAPAVLNPSPLFPFPARANIVDIFNGAKVSMKEFTISGPNGSTCPGLAGVRVIDDASLTIDSSIINRCTREGMLVDFDEFLPNGPQVGHALVTNTDISGYRVIGIQIGGPDTTVKVYKSKIVAANAPETVGQVGIEALFGPKVTILNTKISNNLCNNPACGPDFFTQTQASGIFLLEAAKGASISNNEISNNDLGVAVAHPNDCCKIVNNILKDNRFFGMTLIDGDYKSVNDKVEGGKVGIAAVAIDIDTTATLVNDKITGATTSRQELECCGFNAEIVTIPPNQFQSSHFKSSQAPDVDSDFLMKKFGLVERGSQSKSASSPF